MSADGVSRREFIKAIMMSLPFVAFDWSAFPTKALGGSDDQWDAVIIGSGLGGLSCAAAFARQGFRPLVIEKHNRPGGYATTFKRPGGFIFDVSLHSTSVGDRDGVYNLIPGFPEISDVEFVPHPTLYRTMFPDHDITVPQKNLPAYIRILKDHFPDESVGIDAVIADMQGITNDIGKLSSARGDIDYMRFPVDYPYLFKAYSRTWGQIVDGHLKNPKLKAIISSQWGYYGLPPSKLASIYYAMPAIGYLENGGFYPKGKSQAISDAFVRFIEERGGKVLLNTRVSEILAKDHAAYGIVTDNGTEYKGRAIISNANAYDTFHTMLHEDEFLADYLAKMDTYSVSISSFQIWLGLKKDIVSKVGIKDTEIFYDPSYDPEASFKAALECDTDNPGYGLTLYDNLYDGYSPPGKNTLNIMVLQGYDHWKQFEADYFANKKSEYRVEKERIADILIDKVENTLLPGLRDAIEIKEIGTPLTNVRYTGNYRGGIYGWDQTLDNAMPNRLPQFTPIDNLYLAGAWTQPGHGYGGVIWSGLQCFGEVMKSWG
jgi:phytoene dehydrogenase-like protein